jgi:protocatechuate 4,5-dioxygenase beta chain
MPIGLGIASSHGSPAFLQSAEQWENYYSKVLQNAPAAPQAAGETAEVLDGWVGRIQNGFDTLKKQLEDYGAELLIIIGGDQTEMFDLSHVPNLMMYIGDSAWGYNTPVGALAPRGVKQEYNEADLVRFKVDRETSEMLLNKLVSEEGFDVSFSTEQQNLGKEGMGLPHAFHRPTPKIIPGFEIPTVIVYENTYSPPAIRADRCYEFGKTLARLLKDDPRKIAIYGSGGLSHAFWPATGWVDEEMDRWVLDQFATSNGEATTALYGFDGKNMRGGTGEIRSWITVAGAMSEAGARATVVDYLPAAHAIHGIAFAYWQPSASKVAAAV